MERRDVIKKKEEQSAKNKKPWIIQE